MPSPTTNKRLGIRVDELEEYVGEKLDDMEDQIAVLEKEVGPMKVDMAAANLRMISLQRAMQYLWQEILTPEQRKSLLERADLEKGEAQEEIPRIIVPNMVS